MRRKFWCPKNRFEHCKICDSQEYRLSKRAGCKRAAAMAFVRRVGSSCDDEIGKDKAKQVGGGGMRCYRLVLAQERRI